VVVDVVDNLRAAGVEQIGLITEQDQKTKETALAK
jgi:biopolymer transport protein ExbD